MISLPGFIQIREEGTDPAAAEGTQGTLEYTHRALAVILRGTRAVLVYSGVWPGHSRGTPGVTPGARARGTGTGAGRAHHHESEHEGVD